MFKTVSKTTCPCARFEAFKAVKIQIEIFNINLNIPLFKEKYKLLCITSHNYLSYPDDEQKGN